MTSTIILTPAQEHFPAWNPWDIVGHTGGELEKDTRPPLVHVGRRATTPRQPRRIRREEVTTIRAGQGKLPGQGGNFESIDNANFNFLTLPSVVPNGFAVYNPKNNAPT